MKRGLKLCYADRDATGCVVCKGDDDHDGGAWTH